MKALRYVLLGILLVAVIGLGVYNIFYLKDYDTGNIIKYIVLLASILFSLIRPAPKSSVSNKKVLYQKAYSEFIQSPFAEDIKLEKVFYKAVDDYNRNKPAAGITKLEKLRKECQRTNDLFSVTVFLALCYDDAKLYENAVIAYDAALRIRQNSTLYSNKGICMERLGKLEEAEFAYTQAISCDSKNEYAYNNLSALYFRQEDYENSLQYAKRAISINPKMTQALSTAAICSALLDNDTEYKHYYHQAVLNGYDGRKIKDTVKLLDPTI